MSSLFIGKSIVSLVETTSTNTYAIELLKGVKPVEGTVITAENQTKGRGQRGNEWDSEPLLNLTFSIILYPTFLKPSENFFLSKMVSLALLEVLTELLETSHHDIKIKWPNDIMVNDKKIAGILIENILRHDHIQASVIGIGFNVNQTNFSTYSNNATSIANEGGKVFDKSMVLELVCSKIEKWYLNIRQKPKKTDIPYFENLYKAGVVSIFNDGRNDFSGTIVDVEKDGKIKIIAANDDARFFDFKEVKFIG